MAVRRGNPIKYLLCWLLVLPLLPGCGGCSKKPSAGAKERAAKREELRKKKPKEDFEFLRYSNRPSEWEKTEAGIKPGHWTVATQEIRANNFDFRGELACELENQGQAVDLDQMPFRLRTTRPAVLPKGQRRMLEFPLFAPEEVARHQAGTQLLTRSGGRFVKKELQPLIRMPAHQYFFIVLADKPDSYTYLRSLDSVRAPLTMMMDDVGDPHYRVLLPRIRNRVPLPSGVLNWTSIAYVLWDDLEPKKLTSDQQQALVDWLHWGGQLLVSGPDTLDRLRGSFLEPYLPAAGGGARDLDTAAFAALSTQWDRGGRPLQAARPWGGIQLEPKKGAGVVVATPDGQPLLVERRCGRGRVLVSAFRLGQRELRNWPDFDGFFNACILRRDPRQFQEGSPELITVSFVSAPRYDATRVTRLRLFTRDAQDIGGVMPKDLRPSVVRVIPTSTPMPTQPTGFIGNMGAGYQSPPIADDGPPQGRGAAGWDDFSAASDAARAALREAAGIVVPDRTFVVGVLGIYIVVLVPLNWCVFRLLGRVEWAWAAAPVVAVGCTMAVVWLAQLDIGFARSRTDLSIIEAYADYPRGHLTRYSALYSSLGTSYNVRFDDSTAVALPFPTGRAVPREQSRSTVVFHRTPKVSGSTQEGAVSMAHLEGLEISSNTTGMVHSEQMYDLDGTIRFEALPSGRYRLVNGTRLSLEGAMVVGKERSAWVGSLASGAAVPLSLAPSELSGKNDRGLFADKFDLSPATAKGRTEGALNVRLLIELARSEVAPGELRLVAWTTDEPGGISIQPAASQYRQRTVFLAHLQFGADPPPARDVNTRAEIKRKMGELPAPVEGLFQDPPKP